MNGKTTMDFNVRTTIHGSGELPISDLLVSKTKTFGWEEPTGTVSLFVAVKGCYRCWLLVPAEGSGMIERLLSYTEGLLLKSYHPNTQADLPNKSTSDQTS